MYAANAFFCLQITIWAGFAFAYSDSKDMTSFEKVYGFDVVNKLLPALVLVISIFFFRRQFNSKQAQKVFAKEKKIVLVHLGIFISFIIVFGTYYALRLKSLNSPMTMQGCRYYVSQWYFFLFTVISNTVNLILLIFMSLMLSKPLKGYWVEFLVNYRIKTLSQAIYSRQVPREVEKARSFHDNAVRTASRQVVIMQALVHTAEKNFTATIKDSDNQTMLKA